MGFVEFFRVRWNFVWKKVTYCQIFRLFRVSLSLFESKLTVFVVYLAAWAGGFFSLVYSNICLLSLGIFAKVDIFWPYSNDNTISS